MPANATFYYVYIAILRYAAPILAAFLLFRCIKSLMTFQKEPEIWAWLCMRNGKRIPVTHWENVIGRSKRSDIVINDPAVAHSHAVLTRYDDGSWTVSATDAAGTITVNRKKVDIWALNENDTITIGKEKLKFMPATNQQKMILSHLRTKGSSFHSSMFNLMLLSLFQALCCVAYLLGGQPNTAMQVLLGFGGIMVLQWLLLLFNVTIHRTAFEVETVAFFICTMGMCAIAAVCPGEALKQLIAMVMGIGTFLGIGWSLRDLEWAKKIRHIAAVAGVAFLVITLLFGQEYYGAKNWLVIGSLSIQPSELSKVCFVFVGASAMDRLVRKRNLILFIAYSAAVCGCLALMNDFGTALIFFCTFLVIAYLRSGSVGTLALAISALVFAGVVALKIAPHALQRFETWRHIWDDPYGAGYQQTRALMCIASGGLLGLGAGGGWMKNLFAADSDVVVATIAEEWGLLIVLLIVASVISLAIFTVRSASVGRSSFYTIGACSAASVLLVQVILNALGTVDVLPLTGVTFPFLSNGGSSMICAWGLLAFVKAADTRQNASFAVRLTETGGDSDE